MNALDPTGSPAHPMLYRVVELTRSPQARLHKVVSPWHADLERVRRSAQAVAARTLAHRVWIMSGQRQLVEEVALPAPPFTIGAGLLDGRSREDGAPTATPG